MKLFHRTSAAACARILDEGFRDGEFRVVAKDGASMTGVWFSDRAYHPASLGPVKGEILLELSIPDHEVEPWEWRLDVPDGLRIPRWMSKPYREFYVPAELANRHGPPEIVIEVR